MTSYTPDPRHLGPNERPRGAAGEGTLARQARYSRWDGTQSVADFEADEILEALADDVMAEGDLGEALRRLIERGWRGRDPTRSDLAEIALGHHVVSEGIEDLIGVERRDRLGAVPAGVAGRPCQQPVAAGDQPRTGPEVPGIRGIAGHAAVRITAGTRSRRRSGPC